MLSLPDLRRWLLAFDKSTRLAAAVALGCGSVLGLAKLELIDFGMRTADFRAALGVVGVFATAFVIVAIVAKMWDWSRVEFAAWQRRRAIRADFDDLPAAEMEFLRRRLVEGKVQVFVVRTDDPAAMALVAKRLLRRRTTSSDGRHWQVAIPILVWAEMRRRWMPNSLAGPGHGT